MNLKDIVRNIEVWQDWKNHYGYYVPLFIKEAANKPDWKDWDSDVFNEFFEKSDGQCVSSLKRGYFTKAEKEKIKNNWYTIAPLLKDVADNQNAPHYETYHQVKSIIRQYTNQNRKAATNRLIAALQPNLLSTIINEEKAIHLINLLKSKLKDLPFTVHDDWFRNSYEILNYFKQNIPHNSVYDLNTLPWQTYDSLLGNVFNNNDMSDSPFETAIALLRQKKQIILQGPPGTGKTKLAKELAQALLMIADGDITKYITVGLKIPTTGGQNEYTVEWVDASNRKVMLKRESETQAETSYDIIQKAYREKLWEQRIDQNGARRAASLAMYIFRQLAISESRNELKLLQFHPSYTYEDFVRGIVSKPNTDGDGIVYKAEDKPLARFAKEALENYKNAQASEPDFKQGMLLKSNLERFIDHVQDKINESTENKYDLTENVYIFESDDTRFKYKGDNWKAHDKGLNMKYGEIEKLIAANVRDRSDIKHLDNIEELTKSHATYYARILEKYDTFVKTQSATEADIPEKQSLKNYVLIIDEINRANLSSVLGELIYALEYRSKKVESIYSVDGSSDLILPPNLYIIGTLNTADRSVGRIDYAIRRRFGFVNIPPRDLSSELGDNFYSELFQKVTGLFSHSTNLSLEFFPEDVQLGHSYFIQQFEKDTAGKDIVDRPHDFSLRLNHEIKPILLEYVRDGILIGQKDGLSIADYINSLTV